MWKKFVKTIQRLGVLKYTSVGFSGALICFLLFSPVEAKMSTLGYSILDFQLSWSPNKMYLILDAWRPISTEILFFMVVDMFYPIFYFMTLSGLFLIIRPTIDFIGDTVLSMLALASVADYIENIFTFSVLLSPPVQFEIYALSFFATIKFLLLILCITVILIFGIRRLVSQFFPKGENKIT